MLFSKKELLSIKRSELNVMFIHNLILFNEELQSTHCAKNSLRIAAFFTSQLKKCINKKYCFHDCVNSSIARLIWFVFLSAKSALTVTRSHFKCLQSVIMLVIWKNIVINSSKFILYNENTRASTKREKCKFVEHWTMKADEIRRIWFLSCQMRSSKYFWFKNEYRRDRTQRVFEKSEALLKKSEESHMSSNIQKQWQSWCKNSQWKSQWIFSSRVYTRLLSSSIWEFHLDDDVDWDFDLKFAIFWIAINESFLWQRITYSHAVERSRRYSVL